MKVKDFSKQIVDVSNSKRYSSLPDYFSSLLAITVFDSSTKFTGRLLISSPFPYVSSVICGVSSFMLQKGMKKHINPKLSKQTTDPRFESYGLNAFYDKDIVSLEDLEKETEKGFIKKIKKLGETNPTPLMAVNRFFYHFLKDVADIDSVSGFFNISHKATKLLVSRIKENPKTRKLVEYSPFFLGFAFPPLSHGYAASSIFDYFNKSVRVEEIEKALEIGAQVEKKISEGSSREEIERFLEELKK